MISAMILNCKILTGYWLLHFNKVEFTYAPHCEALANKSRIDFFLVSTQLISLVKSCKIHDVLQNKLFDHKAISIHLNPPLKRAIKSPFISNKVLNSDVLDLIVYSTVAET
jgi:exonuclease III